jgi:hypothetical protein
MRFLLVEKKKKRFLSNYTMAENDMTYRHDIAQAIGGVDESNSNVFHQDVHVSPRNGTLFIILCGNGPGNVLSGNGRIGSEEKLRHSDALKKEEKK